MLSLFSFFAVMDTESIAVCFMRPLNKLDTKALPFYAPKAVFFSKLAAFSFFVERKTPFCKIGPFGSCRIKRIRTWCFLVFPEKLLESKSHFHFSKQVQTKRSWRFLVSKSRTTQLILPQAFHMSADTSRLTERKQITKLRYYAVHACLF